MVVAEDVAESMSDENESVECTLISSDMWECVEALECEYAGEGGDRGESRGGVAGTKPWPPRLEATRSVLARSALPRSALPRLSAPSDVLFPRGRRRLASSRNAAMDDVLLDRDRVSWLEGLGTGATVE